MQKSQSSDLPNKKVDDELKEWNDNVIYSLNYDRDENEEYEKNIKSVFNNALTEEDKSSLEEIQRSTLNFPLLRPFLLNSLKNVRESVPTPYVEANEPSVINEELNQPEEKIAEILTGDIKQILTRNHYKDIIYKVAVNAWAGNKGILKLRTDYKNDYDFSQDIFIENVEDPTLIYFDPSSKKSTKEDAKFVFEINKWDKEDFERLYPDIEWDEVKAQQQYDYVHDIQDGERNAHKEVVQVIKYYYTRLVKSKTIYLVGKEGTDQGEITTTAPKNKKSIKKTREIKNYQVWRCSFVGEIILEKPVGTNFSCLPFVMVEGESYIESGKKKLVPYAKHALDAQRVKNYMMNFFIFEALNNRSTFVTAVEDSLDDSTIDSIRNPTRHSLLEYKAAMEVEGKMMPTPPPQFHSASPLPTQYLEVFQNMDATIEKIMGSQFASLMDKNMSGKALYNLADFISASNEIFMQNLLLATTKIGEILIDTIPRIYSNKSVSMGEKEEKIETIFNYMFEGLRYHIVIERGVNYKLQQQATVEMLLDLAKVSPPFAKFLYTQGMPMLLENMDLKDKNKMLKSYEIYEQKQQQLEEKQMEMMGTNAKQMQQMNQQKIKNEAQNSEARLLDAQAKQLEVAIKKEGLAHQQTSTHLNDLISTMKIAAENKKSELDNLTKLANITTTHKHHMLKTIQGDRHASQKSPY